ncbi:hypothetical protein IT895_03935 [Halomonas sp. A40-4]|uniref:hypothetical protein n=1 Tax=Halomonas sp. A40-4 TaxID=2785909 RepID=UPI0018F02EE9|nr:hypothetical protein [Halomonas sp. A40-4]QPL46955.1 hypothetical protein IT895_03935 [Halomonas sp. A40-4]
MLISKSSLSKYFFLTRRVEEKTLFSNVWLSDAPESLSHLQHFALRIATSLTLFLALPIIMLNAKSIEIIIAVFSVEASTTALMFSKITSKDTTAWLLSHIEDEIVELTNIIGVAGTGSLVVIYMLA